MDTELFKIKKQIQSAIDLINTNKIENIGRAVGGLELLVKDIDYKEKEFENYFKKEIMGDI
jgi:hypothetical protein|tara:strand:+ start:643 stop:825 length:183 start_codon:yes stop_codon:yes gene_type:complete